ncbi:MAG: cation transporter [Muribaculaceae bacterium]|nr:cation transporter [Muribaculaceae bacterium]
MTSVREKKIYFVTAIGSVINILLLIFKFIAGILGRSSAMIADAVHSLSDLLTDVIIFIFVRTASKPIDHTHEYGHGKFETLATLIVGVILIIVGLGIMYEGVKDCIAFFHGDRGEQPRIIALIAAVLSIILKEGAYRYTLREGKKANSPILIANAWHHRSDAYSSIATLVGVAGSMFLGKNGLILDPLAAIVVSFYICKSGYDIIKDSIDELLERSLPIDTEKEIRSILKSIEGIEGVHNLKTRKIGNRIAIEAHTEMDGNISLEKAHQIATKAENQLKRKYGPKTHIGIHMEPKKKTCNLHNSKNNID